MIKLSNDLWFNLSYGARPEHRIYLQPASSFEDVAQLFMGTSICCTSIFVSIVIKCFRHDQIEQTDFCIFVSIGHWMQLGGVVKKFLRILDI